jgi:hypothetical protein
VTADAGMRNFVPEVVTTIMDSCSMVTATIWSRFKKDIGLL